MKNMQSCPLRGCDSLKLVKKKEKEKKDKKKKVDPTDHCEAREQCRGPAGGLQLGPAQVEFPPGQGLHRVVVGADQLQVTASHPVPVVHPPAV